MVDVSNTAIHFPFDEPCCLDQRLLVGVGSTFVCAEADQRIELNKRDAVTLVSLDQLLTESDHQALTARLDPIIRIRAVQNFSPSQAVGFVFFLKNVIRTALAKEIAAQQIEDELVAFESEIDKLSLIAFNLYMQCREKIYELKANEMRNRTFKAFERAGLVKDIPEDEPVPGPIINFSKEASNNT